MEISTFCRVCTKSTFLEYIDLDTPLNDTTYLECFNYCTRLDAKLQDAAPNTICLSCGESLQIAYEFIKTAREADRFLRENFVISKDDIKGEQPFLNETIVANPFNNSKLTEEEGHGFVCLKDEQKYIQPKIKLNSNEALQQHNMNQSVLLNEEALIVDIIEEDNKIFYEEDFEDTNEEMEPQDIKSFESEEINDSFLTMDLQKYKPKKIYKNINICRLCGEVFENKLKVALHQDTDHKGIGEGVCITCGQLFPNEKCLKNHVTEAHAPQLGRFQCQYCPNTFTINTFKTHMNTKHPETLITTKKTSGFPCKICSLHCGSRNQLKDHLNSHTGERPYQCDKCNKSFHSNSNYRSHYKRIHELELDNNLAETRKCNKCDDFSTNNRKLWIKHRNNHFKYKAKYLCAFCPSKFRTSRYLMSHEDYAHGDKKNAPQCHICNKKLRTKTSLAKHYASVHSNERTFQCKECHKAFKSRGTLLNHEKLHYDRNIPCPECDKMFTARADLRVHLRIHTGELPFECHLCDKKFRIKSRLTYHLREHEGYVYKCTHCPEEFKKRPQFRDHLFTHKGYPYICDYCQIGHLRKKNLFRHVRREHGINMTEEDLRQNFIKNNVKYLHSRSKKSPHENDMIAEM